MDIQRLEVIEGSLPRRALALVLEWAYEHMAHNVETITVGLRRS